MRLSLFFALLFMANLAVCQTHGNQNNVYVYKYLRNSNDDEIKIVYFPATRDYYPCGGPETPRKKVQANETLLDKVCDCSSDGGVSPLRPTAYLNIQFGANSSTIRSSSYQMLDNISANLKANAKAITIGGYASSDEGTAANAMRLSKDRANAVKTYLVQSGVDPKLLKVKGYGETRPVADNSTEDGRVLNRRVELKADDK